jgi:hypothetical protein
VIIQRIPVTPSVLIATAVSVVHLAAAGVVWLAPVPLAVKAPITLAVAVSLVFFMARDAALHAAQSIVALDLKENGEIALQTRGGAWLDCELLGSSYVSAQMTVINLRPRGSRRLRSVILVRDNVDPRDFRRLRIWLRWKRGEAAGGAVRQT